MVVGGECCWLEAEEGGTCGKHPDVRPGCFRLLLVLVLVRMLLLLLLLSFAWLQVQFCCCVSETESSLTLSNGRLMLRLMMSLASSKASPTYTWRSPLGLAVQLGNTLVILGSGWVGRA